VLNRIFPMPIDNDYRGSRLAIGIFVPIVLVNVVMGANTMINTRDVIQGADGIPVDSFDPAAARIIVASFKSWGLGHLLLASLGLLALTRYRAMLPFLYLLFTLENVGRKALQHSNPLRLFTSSGEPAIGAMINLALLAALLVGFALSLGERREPGARDGHSRLPRTPDSG